MNYHEAYQNYVALNNLARDMVITEDERQQGVEDIREAVGLNRRPTDKDKDVCSTCKGNKLVGGGNGHKSVTCYTCGVTGQRSVRV